MLLLAQTNLAGLQLVQSHRDLARRKGEVTLESHQRLALHLLSGELRLGGFDLLGEGRLLVLERRVAVLELEVVRLGSGELSPRFGELRPKIRCLILLQ